MKRRHNLAPSTIRRRHGALARCFDWMLRKHPEIMAQNPLRLLKRGFASYTEADAAALALSGREARVDVERDRRLADGEEAAMLEVLASSPVERTFFCLALDTAMRMREGFTFDPRIRLALRSIPADEIPQRKAALAVCWLCQPAG